MNKKIPFTLALLFASSITFAAEHSTHGVLKSTHQPAKSKPINAWCALKLAVFLVLI